MNDLTLINPPPGMTAKDYAAIEDAVMETARGRWFLLEYARRQRAAETQRMAEAVDRLERAIDNLQPQLAGVIPPAPPPVETATPTNETAAAVAERLSDIVWTMRERGVGDQFCVELEKQIRIVRTLRVEIEAGREQIATAGAPKMIEASPPADGVRGEPARAAAPLHMPPAPLQMPPPPLQMPPPWRPPEASQPEPAPARKAAPPPAPCENAASRLDSLPLMEKIALFC